MQYLLYQYVLSQNNHNYKASTQVLQRATLSTTEYLDTGEVTGNAWMRYWYAFSAFNFS